MIGRRISTTHHRGSDARKRLKSSGLGLDEILLVAPYSEKEGLQRAWQMSHASFMFCLRELLPEESESGSEGSGEEEEEDQNDDDDDDDEEESKEMESKEEGKEVG